MRSNRWFRSGSGSLSLLLFSWLVLSKTAAGQNTGPVRVQAEVTPGPYFVGQGFELHVGAIAGRERPKIELPRLTDARIWTIGTEIRPISATGIGSVVAHENVFVVRFRLVPTRAGMLEIPAIPAQIQGRSGRSQTKRLSIQPVPLAGRPAEFLGGVGRFELEAAVSAKVARAGQEIDYRITITGPAAWGTTARPDMERFGRLGLGLRIKPKPDQTSDEPPVRTFVFRLRPTRAGEAVLPPVAIAAFDPSLSRYVTHVTKGVPIRVVAVPSFDPTTIDYDAPRAAAGRTGVIIAGATALATILVAAYILLRRARRRLKLPRPFGADRARRFAKYTVRYLRSVSVATNPQSSEPSNLDPQFESLDFAALVPSWNSFPPSTWKPHRARTIFKTGSPEIVRIFARRISERLALYLRLGTGHSPRALTPDEARQGVARVTNSEELAARAGRLIARCDSILYGDLAYEPARDAPKLIDDARRLFEALGRVKNSHRHGG